MEVRADYELWCGSPADCMIIRGWRETLKLRTKVIATSLKQLEHLIASRTNVSIGDVRRATNGSVWDGIQGHGCPSAEVLKVWLAKPFLVEASMALHPEHHQFAWVDAGFNIYRMARRRPPAAPWLTFSPAAGRLAVRKHPGACHNFLRGTARRECVLATFMFGSRDAWHVFVERYAARLRELLLLPGCASGSPTGLCAAGGTSLHQAQEPQRMLCSEQDVMEDVASASPALVDEFTTADHGGYGWAHAVRVTARCATNQTNILNECYWNAHGGLHVGPKVMPKV